jgi:hypothetical protein
MKYTNRMNRIIYVTFVMAAVMTMLCIPAMVEAYPRIVVSGFDIKDGNASVGKDFTLSLKISNMDQECAVYIATDIQATGPFIMKGISAFRTNELCQGEQAVIDIPLRIDPTATGGTYQLMVSNSYETSTYAEYSSSDTINIFVNGTPDINAYITNSEPIDVYPGDTAVLTFTVENDGTFQAQDVTANLSADAPLIAKWSNSFATLGVLDAKQDKNAQFIIGVPKDAKIQDYPMHLTIKYYDENHELQTTESTYTFHVKNKALFQTSDAGSDTLYPSKDSSMVRLILKNTGTDVAEKIKVKIQPQFPFSTDGSVRYIEKLAPGESAPVEFAVNVDKDGTVGTYGLDMIIDYEDAQGNTLQDNINVPFKLQGKNIFQAVFIDYWFLWLIVIIVAAVIIMRRANADKKKISKK